MMSRRPRRWVARCVVMALLLQTLWSSVGARECGENPMRQIMLVANKTGRPVDHVLDVLRDIDAATYEHLAMQFRLYAACVGLVDTGYFRKRSDPNLIAHPETESSPSSAIQAAVTKWREWDSRRSKPREQGLLDAYASLMSYESRNHLPADLSHAAENFDLTDPRYEPGPPSYLLSRVDRIMSGGPPARGAPREGQQRDVTPEKWLSYPEALSLYEEDDIK